MDNQEVKEKAQSSKKDIEIKKLSDVKLIKFYLKKKSLKIKIVGSVLLLMLIMSCKSLDLVGGGLPYVFLESYIEYNSNASYVNFILQNISKKDIDFIDVVVKLKEVESELTEEAEQEYYETTLSKSYNLKILSNEQCELVLPLSYTILDSEKEFEIELIYVSEIHFSDGSIWKDYSGVYAF